MKNLILMGLSIFLVSGCATKSPEVKKESFECKQENVSAPSWTCIPEVKGFYSGVGIAEKSAAGTAHMRKVALMNGRSDLAQQIESQVKDKIEGFTQVTGFEGVESIDQVTTSVTKQVSKMNLYGTKAIDMWNAPSGALFILVTIPEKNVNQVVQDSVKSSFNKDDSRWQIFQSEEALKALEMDFPTE